MYYTLYRVIHTPTKKEYIGIHKTKNLDDGYMGSGKYIKRAIQKHGVDQFEKEILHVFDNEDDMRKKERELVTEEYCLRKDTYNLCVGGGYGFSYIHRLGLAHNREVYDKISKTAKRKGIGPSKQCIEATKKRHREGRAKYDNMLGKKHSEETKTKMSKTRKGKGLGEHNSQYGTMWITNGVESKKISINENMPIGWVRGRLTIPNLKVKIDLCSYCYKLKKHSAAIRDARILYEDFLNKGYKTASEYVRDGHYQYSVVSLTQKWKKYIPEYQPATGRGNKKTMDQ